MAFFLLFKSKRPVELRNLKVDLMHTISVMKMKFLQCYQQYLNLSTPLRLLPKKIFNYRHQWEKLNLISPESQN